MTNFKTLIPTLFFCLLTNWIFAQNLRVENQAGQDVITLSAVNGAVSSRSIFAVSSQATIGNVNYANVGISVSSGMNNSVTGYANVDSLGSNALLGLGDASITGSLWISSDRNLKKDIKEMDSVLDQIKKLRPSWYQYEHPQIGAILPKGNQTGFVAQEIQEVFPHLVTSKYATGLDSENHLDKNTTEYKAVNYIGLIPVLCKAIQEQQEIIADYQIQFDMQEKRISRLESLLLNSNSSQRAENSLPEISTGIRLEQNTPNPFQEFTTINYFIPEKATQAQLMVFDPNGKTIQSHDLEFGKESSIEISLQNLPSGVYVYGIISNLGNSSKLMIYKN